MRCELRLKDLFLEEKRERTEVRLCVYARTAYCSADFCLHFLPATVHSIWKQVLPQPAIFLLLWDFARMAGLVRSSSTFS